MSDENVPDFSPFITDDDWDTYEDAHEDLPIRRAVERSLAAGRDDWGLNPQRPSSASHDFHSFLMVS
jgi:hypothetical protein